MNSVKNISADKYPKQGSFLNKIVEVCFHYDTTATMCGMVIRDDIEEPGELIILLENGWVVRSQECQYRLAPSKNTTD